VATSTRTTGWIGTGLLGAALLTLAACGGGDGKEKSEKAGGGASRQTVSAATVSVIDMPRTVTASGTVSAWEEVPVGAETGGLTATAVYVDEGSYVRQGQPLVQMNDVLLRAQLRQQQASVQTAEANAARDDAALSRAQELKARGFLSQASLDTALPTRRRRRRSWPRPAPRCPKPRPACRRPRSARPSRARSSAAMSPRARSSRLATRCSAWSATAGWSWTPRSPRPTCR